MDIDFVAIVLYEPARDVKTDGVRPLGFREHNQFGESSRSCRVNAFREESACNPAIVMSLEYGHSDDSRPARLEQQTNRTDNLARMFRHEEVGTCLDEGSLYIVKVRIQGLVDKSEMLPQSLKNNVSGRLLVPWIKLSND